jgi:hypothetical protein
MLRRTLHEPQFGYKEGRNKKDGHSFEEDFVCFWSVALAGWPRFWSPNRAETSPASFGCDHNTLICQTSLSSGLQAKSFALAFCSPNFINARPLVGIISISILVRTPKAMQTPRSQSKVLSVTARTPPTPTIHTLHPSTAFPLCISRLQPRLRHPADTRT